MKIYEYNEIIKIAKKIESGELKETKNLLMLQDKNGWRVAHQLALYSDKTGWSTNDKEILMLQTKYGTSVAHRLTYWHPTWTTEELEILSLIDEEGESIEDTLIERGKI